MWSTNHDVFCNRNQSTGVPLNTLQYKCIQQVANTAAGKSTTDRNSSSNCLNKDFDIWLNNYGIEFGLSKKDAYNKYIENDNDNEVINNNDDDDDDDESFDNHLLNKEVIQSIFQQFNRKSGIRSNSSSSLASSTSMQSVELDYLVASCIPFCLRQQLHDHAIREQVALNANFLCQLLSDGGLCQLDLWSLCDISNFSRNQICQILQCIAKHGHNLQELSLGGGIWLFDEKIVSTAFRQLICNGNLQQLRRLRLQSTVDQTSDLICLLSRCHLLQKFEIAQPSITDEQLLQLSKQSSLQNLSIQELHLPSSITGQGLAYALGWLPQLRSLHCAHFENLIDYLNDIKSSFQFNTTCDFDTLRLESVLESLHTLQIDQPLSADLPACIAKLCPNLRRLRLETQELMQLQPLADLQYLQVLHLHNSNSFGCSYLTDILPLLREIGHQLIELNLEQFDVIDVNELGSICPNLQALSVQWFSILGIGRTNRFGAHWVALPEADIERDPTILLELPERLKHRNHFQHLRFLRLRPRVQRPLPVHLVQFMVCNSPALQYLEFYGIQQASEQYWNQIMTCPCNGWSRLKYLIARQGTEISLNCIDQLLRKTDQLTYLECKKPPFSKTDLTYNH